ARDEPSGALDRRQRGGRGRAGNRGRRAVVGRAGAPDARAVGRLCPRGAGGSGPPAARRPPPPLARPRAPTGIRAVAGWRGRARGVVAAGAAALRGDEADAELAAVIGPSVGPCCYEVGADVSGLFEPDLTRDGKLDLWAATERLLRVAGVARIERVDLC